MPAANYKIGCVLMAAGNATRFAGNKLTAVFEGKTLFDYALDVIPADELYRVVVVTQYTALAACAIARGFETVHNAHPDMGLSHTIALGTTALSDADAILFLVADQPLLKEQSVRNAIALHRANPGFIVSLAFSGRRGNPCIFPREFFPALCSLSGDTGGSAIIRQNAHRLLLCNAQDERELLDIDTVETLRGLSR